jgi:hypothetical protein
VTPDEVIDAFVKANDGLTRAAGAALKRNGEIKPCWIFSGGCCSAVNTTKVE